ncbi:hypothetical protein GGI16_003479, partial [Coemansia sp. S142-1]
MDHPLASSEELEVDMLPPNDDSKHCAMILTKLADIIQVNMEMDLSKPCPLLEAVVRIPTANLKHHNRHQMKLNPSQCELISKHVAELLNKGYIMLALPGCPYSLMLYLMLKKDDMGMMTD